MTTTTLDFSRARAMSTAQTTKVDNSLWKQTAAIIGGLLVFGAIEVFSASRYQGEQLKNNLYYFGLIHLLFVILSIVIMFGMQLISSKVWKKLTWVSYIAVFILLIVVYFFSAENGSHRWIPLGSTGFTVQPSEFAKIASIMLGAFIFSTVKWEQDKSYVDHIIRFAIASIPVALMMILILLQPDLGNIVVIGASYATMYIVTSNKWKSQNLMVLLVVALVVGALAVAIEPYRFERITTQLEFMRTGVIQDEFGKGLQLRNILVGVGSGGLWGKGIGGSRLKNGYFVEVTAFTDSIAAVIFEELGFFLGAVFVGVYVYLFLLFVRIAEAQKGQYQRLIMWGIAIWFISQSFMHFGANVALIPVKGITLPFISYGGSSMIAFAVVSGMAIRLARHPSETA